MKRKKRGKYGSRQQRWMLCEWCGDHGQTTRSDTKTCGGKCRQRLANFVKVAGYAPDKPPGKMTTGEAIDLEIERLFRAERARREANGMARNQ